VKPSPRHPGRVRHIALLTAAAWWLGSLPGAADRVRLECSAKSGPVAYAASLLTRAIEASGDRVNGDDEHATGPVKAAITLATDGSGKAESYRIARSRGPQGVPVIGISGSDERGTLYGAMNLVEAIENGRPLTELQESSHSARFPFRAIKFNLPWFSYRKGEALALHRDTCRDPAYWEAFLDMMARNRFNALSLWSLHPYPLMIRNRRFPEACPLSDAELAEWQAFWRTLFAMAKERGIETYIVNWNIFVSPSFAEKHGVAEFCIEDMDDRYFGDAERAEIVEEYTRTTITQLIDEYPDLTGIGVSLGERMGGMDPEEREDWILDSVVAGMKAAKRRAKLIHRAPFSAGKGSGGSTSAGTEELTRSAIESLALPEPIWVEVKFNWSHAHSSPKLVHVHGGRLGDTYWNPLPENYRICWMARNEDFFCLRWSEPDFVRKHVELNGHDYVGGYFLGSECYIPAKDYMTKPGVERQWNYAFERQWLYYMTWGRLLYDPATPDDIFADACVRRYGEDGRKLFRALKLASRMPLRLGSFYKGTWDFTLYSEGFSSINAKSNPDRFIGVEDLIKQPVLDPDYLSIRDFVAARRSGTAVPDSTITPLKLADHLEADGNEALVLAGNIDASGKPGLSSELTDVRAWAHLSLYFADKLRGATAFHEMAQGADERKTDAVAHLTRALAHWDDLITVTEPAYAVMPLAQIHKKNRPFHWKRLRPQVVRDLELVKQR
jgi:hypothetical protein